jgi:hypothetical protein
VRVSAASRPFTPPYLGSVYLTSDGGLSVTDEHSWPVEKAALGPLPRSMSSNKKGCQEKSSASTGGVRLFLAIQPTVFRYP